MLSQVVVDAAFRPPEPIGLARLATTAFRGGDLRPVAAQLGGRLQSDPSDAVALFDLGIIFQLFGERGRGLAQQARAISIAQVYRWPPSGARDGALSLLMFAVPGDFMANTPIEFILRDMPVRLDVAYLGPNGRLPDRVPDHDVAFVGIGESAEVRGHLRGLSEGLADWPRPVLNAPLRIIDLARERLFGILADAPGIDIPATAEVGRDELARIGDGSTPLNSILPDAERFPLIVRPVGSHAGQGLEKLDNREAIAGYLDVHDAERCFVSRFVDYASADGLYRKYRIAIIDGVPFLCHMAISAHWMVHYLNAGMTEDPAKRAEEAHVMASFETDFARRHAQGFAALHERVGLDYFAVDCAETRNGDLLVFEADTAMIIHSMDPPEMFPYKAAQMEKAYAAFEAMLSRAAGV